MTRFFLAVLSLSAFFTCGNQLIAQDFRVQIAAYGERMKPSFFQERGIENYVETTDQLGLYRYFAGAYKTRDEAEVVRKEVAAKGFPYALIIDLEEQRVLCGACLLYTSRCV